MPLLFVILVGLMWWLQNWHKKNGLRGVEYDFTITRVLAATDEEFELVTTLTNYSRRFVPYIKVSERLPANIVFHEAVTTPEEEAFLIEPMHVSKTYLFPHGRWVGRLRCSLPARGRYAFNRGWIWGGDFLGVEENSTVVTRNMEIVVYPEAAEGSYINQIMGGFLGDLSVRRFIIEDPVLTVGYREYTGREPLKDISWMQSARTGVVMVKTHDYTTEPSASVVLNAEGTPEAVEECLQICHAVCKQLETQRIQYDFYANFSTLGAEYATWKHLHQGLGKQHFYKVLEGLGRATYNTFESLPALLGRALAQRDSNKGLVLITAGPEAEARTALAGRADNRVVIFSAAAQKV